MLIFETLYCCYCHYYFRYYYCYYYYYYYCCSNSYVQLQMLCVHTVLACITANNGKIIVPARSKVFTGRSIPSGSGDAFHRFLASSYL